MTKRETQTSSPHRGWIAAAVALALATPAARAETCDAFQERLRALDQSEGQLLGQATAADMLGMTNGASLEVLCLTAQRLTLEADFYRQCFKELGYTKLGAGELARDCERRAAIAKAYCPRADLSSPGKS